jgi:hypothetical protein
LLFRECKEEN